MRPAIQSLKAALIRKCKEKIATLGDAHNTIYTEYTAGNLTADAAMLEHIKLDAEYTRLVKIIEKQGGRLD